MKGFLPEDFKRMRFNIYDLPKETSVVDKFPELLRYEEFKKKEVFIPDSPAKLTGAHLPADHVHRYIILCYDKGSPLLKEPDLNKRKRIAAELAGMKYSDTKKESGARKIRACQSEMANKMMLRIIRSCHDLEYALLTSITEHYWTTIAQINSPEVWNKDGDVLKDTETKNKLGEQLFNLMGKIKEMSKDIFHGDETLLYTADEMNEEEAEESSGYPEMYARKARKKKQKIKATPHDSEDDTHQEQEEEITAQEAPVNEMPVSDWPQEVLQPTLPERNTEAEPKKEPEDPFA